MGRCYQLAISLSGAVLITIVLAAAWATRKPSPVNSPIVVNTWAFTKATEKAWEVLTTSQSGSAALDSVEHGCGECERLQCDFTVGYGGSPDEEGETTLDALIMDGTAIASASVTDLRYVSNAIGTARKVMQYSTHSSLGGLQATTFAMDMGSTLSNLSTKASSDMYYAWKGKDCQPNFRKNVHPDPTKSCGPYRPITQDVRRAALASDEASRVLEKLLTKVSGEARELTEVFKAGTASKMESRVSRNNHDTISMIALDSDGNIAAGSSTNGANHKIPGRMSDSAVAGAGAYADSRVGGCGSTGDGDIHLRFLPCYQAVESMRQGLSPKKAAEDAVRRIAEVYPSYVGALVTLSYTGEHGAAAHGWTFEYSVRDTSMTEVTVFKVSPMDTPRPVRAKAATLWL